MKKLVEFFLERKILFKKIKTVTPATLNSRKRIDIYFAVDIKGYYNAIISIDKKSRILQKEADEIDMIANKLQEYFQCCIKKRYLLLQAPICSKASNKLIDMGWKIYDFS